MTKREEKLFRDASRYALMAGMNVTEENVRERYEEYAARMGKDNAILALKNTVKAFCELARKEEARLFNLVKAECLQKRGFTPANKRTFRAELHENPAFFEDIPAAQEYARRYC